MPTTAWCRRASWPPLLLLLAAAGCGSPTDTVEDRSVLGVTVEAAHLATLRDVATAPGTVVPSAATDWTIDAPEPAEIVDLPLAVGDTVQAGDLLVRFEIPSRTQALAALELSVADAEASLARAQQELARQTDLFDRGIVSRNDFDAARRAQAAAMTQANEARTRYETVQADADPTVVRARFAGTVLNVWHARGDQVAGGPTDPVLRVVDPTRVQIAVQLPVAQRARVVPGQQATVRPLTSDAELPASVALTPESAGPGATSAEVRLSLNAPTDLALDTPVSVEILLDVRSSALVVPATALQRDALAAYVMVAGEDGLAHRQDVRVGLATADEAQILSGLEPGTRVITGGLTDESEGLPVDIVP